MNKFKEVPPQEEPKVEKTSRTKKSNKIALSFLNIFSGNFLSKDNVIRQLPFIIFLTLIGLCYIANGYYAEKSVREISRINAELKELKSEYITTKSELMFMSNQSEVARSSASLGLKESVVPPKKIVVRVNKTEENKN
ncbi:MAG TPA: FtsL-like putative cell division protein [Bacteroidia bacterium]